MNSAADKNESGWVIFDGSCNFCLARIDELKQRDTQHRLQYIARQAEETEKLFPQVKDRRLDDGILFVNSAGRVSVAADAMFEICRRLPSLKGFTWLYQIPLLKPIFRSIYLLIATNRKRLGQTCHNNVCGRS